jgi:CheY-like chemotaxis protein
MQADAIAVAGRSAERPAAARERAAGWSIAAGALAATALLLGARESSVARASYARPTAAGRWWRQSCRCPPRKEREPVEPARVLICDDHAHFRDGLLALLSTSAEVEVVGEASDGAAAVAAVLALQPDVVLMDLTMPGTGGVEATRQVLAACPHVGVLVLSMVSDDDSVFAALLAGARGYLLKGARKAEILRAVRAVASGEAIFGAAVAEVRP